MSRVVVVTGGAKGIGRATVAAFAAHGDRVVALGRDAEALGALGESLGVAGRAVETRTCDVADEDAGRRDLRRHRRRRRARQQRGRRRERAADAHDARVLDPAPRGQRHRRLPLHARGARRHARARRAGRSSPSRRPRAASARPTRPRTPRPSTPPSGSCARPPPSLPGTRVTAERGLPDVRRHRHDARSVADIVRATGRDEAASERGAGVRIAARPAARARGGRRRVSLARVARRGLDQRADHRPRRRRHPVMSPFRASRRDHRELGALPLRGRRRRRDRHARPAREAQRADLRGLRRPARPRRRAAPPRATCEVARPRGRGPRLLLRRRRRGDHRRAAEDEGGRAARVHADDRRRRAGAARRARSRSSRRSTASPPARARCSRSPATSACSPAPPRSAFLFTHVGLAGADMGAAYLLPRIVGARARDASCSCSATRSTAEEALALGLATSVVDDDELRDATTALARRLADGPSLAYAATKSLIQREQDMDLAGLDRARGDRRRRCSC